MISWTKLPLLIVVLKSTFLILRTEFIHQAPEMMENIRVLRLDLQGLLVIDISLTVATDPIKAECSVEESFEVLRVDRQGSTVVFDRLLEELLLAVGETTVVVEVSLLWV